MLPEVGGNVVRRIVRAHDHAALACKALATRMRAGVVLNTLEAVHARIAGQVRHTRHAGGQHQMGRTQAHRLAVTLDLHRPGLAGLVKSRRAANRLRPVVELHQRAVGLEPVAHLVLGRVDRPVLWKGQVRQVVIPDRVVQTQRLVSVAPGIAWAFVAIDDQGGHAQALQARAQAQAALAATDDQAIGLLGVAH